MAKEIELTLKGFKELQEDLKICAKEAIPYACRDALNTAAFDARKTWQGEMDKKFVIRNKFVQGSVRVEKVSHSQRDISRMEAKVGSLFGPMETQEAGGTISGKGSHAVPIARRTNPTKPVTRSRWQTKIHLWPGRPRYGSARQRNAINISHAMRHDGRFIELATKHGPMIAEIAKREPIQLRIIWNLTKQSVHVSPHRTLEPTMAEVERVLPQRMATAIVNQLKRRKILGYR